MTKKYLSNQETIRLNLTLDANQFQMETPHQASLSELKKLPFPDCAWMKDEVFPRPIVMTSEGLMTDSDWDSWAQEVLEQQGSNRYFRVRPELMELNPHCPSMPEYESYAGFALQATLKTESTLADIKKIFTNPIINRLRTAQDHGYSLTEICIKHLNWPVAEFFLQKGVGLSERAEFEPEQDINPFVCFVQTISQVFRGNYEKIFSMDQRFALKKKNQDLKQAFYAWHQKWFDLFAQSIWTSPQYLQHQPVRHSEKMFKEGGMMPQHEKHAPQSPLNALFLNEFKNWGIPPKEGLKPERTFSNDEKAQLLVKYLDFFEHEQKGIDLNQPVGIELNTFGASSSEMHTESLLDFLENIEGLQSSTQKYRLNQQLRPASKSNHKKFI